MGTFGFVESMQLATRGRGTCTHRRREARCALSTAIDIASAVKNGSVTAEEMVKDHLHRIDSRDGRVNAFLTVDAESALRSARHIDHMRAQGRELGPLAGVPISVKDNLCTQGIATSAGSKILENYVPPYTATAVARMEAAGAVVLGKTNLDEYGMGSSTESSAFTATNNPWNFEHVPGGSSGGAAAAVAAGECVIALGSDTGGSIRQPASYCGVTGLKCTYGRVSRYGLLAYASSLDTVGPITTNVVDAALALQVMAGKDPCDSTTLSSSVPNYVDELRKDGSESLKGLRVGVIEEGFGAGVDKEVVQRVGEAIEVLKSLGAEVKNVHLPRLREGTSAYYILAPSEASANLARYDGIRYGTRHNNSANVNELYTKSRADGFGAEVKRRIMVGTFALSTGYYDAFYLRAQKVRTLISKDFKDAFDSGVDVLVSPVAPEPAFKIGEKLQDPVSMYAQDILTIPASLAGLPALSVPCGLSAGKLPIGLQIIGANCGEPTVLRVGHAYQTQTEFHKQLPSL
eukprot:Plantae.Rhodophyta-Purpureofilum_apyrenoidigerum.ctg19393.p1 GENE.Plantae.Rhodophyta-Purpureofilum_apyrenoidigerum.ctg19393~~Plantae.Rhodophyta-Purpureofilum_apyrenoidigerum.ctg19393.p1  ORF type:complete len:518 (-),score=58.78 Plantae.Rhodophyta-Purpureofilum_apyrenoidigerum.ctg19393:759-2312(-)